MKLHALLLLLPISAGLANTVQAATTGILTFRGQINAGTCDLSAGDVSRTITLPPVKISDFASSQTPGTIQFNLTADCESDIKNVYFLFTGTPSTGNAALFANTGTSAGTALAFAHHGYAWIPANGTPAQRTRQIATTGGKAVIGMSASYSATGAAITKGTLISTMTVSITYN